MSKESKYAKDSIIGVAGKVSQLVGGYGSLWLLTSILSDVAYGGYVAALAAIALIALLAQAGLKQATIQRVGELAVDENQAIPEYAGAAIAWVGIGSLGVTIATWLLAPLMSPFVDPSVLEWVQLLTLLVPGMALLPICGGILRGLERVSTAVVLERITVQVIRLFGLAIVWLYWQDPAAVVLALGLAYYVPVGLFALRTRGWQYLNVTGMPISHIRYSGYLLVNSIASQFLKNTDVLLLASLATLPATGGYNVAWKLAIVARYGDQILTNTIQPRLSKYLAASDITELVQEFNQVRDLSTFATIPVLIVVLLFGESLLGLFGAYSNQYAVLVVLTVGATVNAMFGSIGQILIMGKRGRLLFVNTIINLGGNIALNLLLIPRYGTMGAALATVFTVYFLTNLIAMLEVYYFMQIDTIDWMPLLSVTILSLVVVLAITEVITTTATILTATVIGLLLLRRHTEFIWELLSAVWQMITQISGHSNTNK